MKRLTVPVVALLAALPLSACGGTPQPTLPPDELVLSDWIDGDVPTEQEFTEEGRGDLVLRRTILEQTPTGTRLTIETEGDEPLGFRILHSGLVMDAPSYLGIDLSGLAGDHVRRVLRTSPGGGDSSWLNVSDQYSSGSLAAQPPVRYRYGQPDAQTLVVEVEEVSGSTQALSADFAVPIDPTPPPWEGVDFTQPGDTLTSEGYGTAPEPDTFNQPFMLQSLAGAETEVRLRFEDNDAVEWQAEYVDAAVDPVTGEPLDLEGEAILRISFSGVGTPPNADAVGFGERGAGVDTWVSSGEDTGVVLWIGMPTARPFTVVADPGGQRSEPEIAVAIE